MPPAKNDDAPSPPVPDALRVFVPGAAAGFLDKLRAQAIPHALREHEPARYARHLASIWGTALHETARATLFQADDRAVLAIVPADRKVSAPLFRSVLGAAFLRVLRGDRGVGRLGWNGLPGDPGPLPALPAAYAAGCYVDEAVLHHQQVIFSLEPSRSVSLAPIDYIRLVNATLAQFVGATRLLPEGGMVDDPPVRGKAVL